MTKTDLEDKIVELESEIANRDKTINMYEDQERGGVWLPHNENSHYQELQQTTLKSMEKADKLQDANIELIKAIANLNGGVLKDLSETIVNLTKR